MSRRVLAVLTLALTAVAVAPHNSVANTSMTLVCAPATPDPSLIPSRRSGTLIFVEARLENDSCFEDDDYGKVQVGLVGNADNSLAGLGIFGPFRRDVTGTVPAAQCPFWCAEPAANRGQFCSVDSDCDTSPGSGDGVCPTEYVEGTDSFKVAVTELPMTNEDGVWQVVVGIEVDGKRVVRNCDIEVVP